MGEFKEKNGQTRVGRFLEKSAPWILDVAGDLTGVDALNALSDVISNDSTIKEGDRLQALALLQNDIQDRQNARDMQKAALQQSDLFSKRFVYYLASFIMFTLFVLMIMLFYVTIPEGNGEIIYMAVGMFLGIASTVAAFFFGSSQGSKDKQAGIAQVLQSLKK